MAQGVAGASAGTHPVADDTGVADLAKIPMYSGVADAQLEAATLTPVIATAGTPTLWATFARTAAGVLTVTLNTVRMALSYVRIHHYEPTALTPAGTITITPATSSGERTLYGLNQSVILAITDAGSADGMYLTIDGSMDATGGYTFTAGAGLSDGLNLLANVPTGANAGFEIVLKRKNGGWVVWQVTEVN